MKKAMLVIMDGLGVRNNLHGNAFMAAKHPNLDYLMKEYPNSLLDASGESVGLPKGQMGNSEVGHTNIGAGRLVYQPMQLITKSIENGEILHNKNILEVINHTKLNNSKLHIMGLLSDGGIHSHIKHLMGIIDMCDKNGINDLYFHLFLDGRDTLPNVAYNYIKDLEDKISEINKGTICTLHGRYYAMDRDNNWDRIKLSYDAIVNGLGEKFTSSKEAINSNYKNGIYDEFVVPCIINDGKLTDNDGIILFNYRPDRVRELFSAFTNPNFKGFERQILNNIKLVTLMPVSDEVICTNAFHLQKLDQTFGEYISEKGLRQLRIAETEKYAHVTYFFDGGVEKDLVGCDRVLIPSPKVATYDLKPEMSVYEVTDSFLKEVENYDVTIINLANGDMVGHTGNYEKAKEAVEHMDRCLTKIYNKVEELKGTLILTADHGNCDVMWDCDKKPVTSHTTNPVFFIVTKENIELNDGKLADIAPTMLELLGLEIPKEMTGKSLIKKDN